MIGMTDIEYRMYLYIHSALKLTSAKCSGVKIA